MAKYKLEILGPAQAELEELAQIYMGLAGADSAQKLTNRIYEAINHLKMYPNMGIVIKELRDEGYRALIVDNNICIYRLVENTIFVYHIVDGRSNYPKLFNELSNGHI